MPRSWIKSGYQLAQTFFAQFWRRSFQVQCQNIHLDLKAITHDLKVEDKPNVYGGQLIPDISVCHPVALQMGAQALPYHLIRQSTHALIAPLTLKVSCHSGLKPTGSQVNAYAIPKLRFDITSTKLAIPQFDKAKGDKIGHFELLKLKSSQSIPITRLKKTLAHPVTLLRKPRSFVLPKQLQALPIHRKPIPPQQFSPETQFRFRKALAEKSQLRPSDIQLLRIYDRMHLTAYQAITPGENGVLHCQPKMTAFSDDDKTKPTPVYLIIGQSAKLPNKTLQTILPMMDSPHDKT